MYDAYLSVLKCTVLYCLKIGRVQIRFMCWRWWTFGLCCQSLWSGMNCKLKYVILLHHAAFYSSSSLCKNLFIFSYLIPQCLPSSLDAVVNNSISPHSSLIHSTTCYGLVRPGFNRCQWRLEFISLPQASYSPNILSNRHNFPGIKTVGPWCWTTTPSSNVRMRDVRPTFMTSCCWRVSAIFGIQ
jgi:hypothetical protein